MYIALLTSFPNIPHIFKVDLPHRLADLPRPFSSLENL